MVNPEMVGKGMFIPSNTVLIGLDPHVILYIFAFTSLLSAGEKNVQAVGSWLPPSRFPTLHAQLAIHQLVYVYIYIYICMYV